MGSLLRSGSSPAMDGAAPLLLGLHGRLLRLVCAHAGCHFEGLAVAGRYLFKQGAIDSATKKKLQNLDVVAAFLRHVSEPLCEGIVANVGDQLKKKDKKEEDEKGDEKEDKKEEDEKGQEEGDEGDAGEEGREDATKKTMKAMQAKKAMKDATKKEMKAMQAKKAMKDATKKTMKAMQTKEAMKDAKKKAMKVMQAMLAKKNMKTIVIILV